MTRVSDPRGRFDQIFYLWDNFNRAGLINDHFVFDVDFEERETTSM